MIPCHFSVSQVRTAATCPRILYFDIHPGSQSNQPSSTRIWKTGTTAETALGTLFHKTIEAFNRSAQGDQEVLRLLHGNHDPATLQQALGQRIYHHYLDRDRLFKASDPQQKNFTEALSRYLEELAKLLSFGIKQGVAAEQLVAQMFGSRQRRMDVTFVIGRENLSVRIVGELDYLFYDWRSQRQRIIDFKLTPASGPSNDLFQVCVYALMYINA